jgi:hypothetical protein
MAQPGLDEAQQNYIHERIKILLQASLSRLTLVNTVSQEVKQRFGTRIDNGLLQVRP